MTDLASTGPRQNYPLASTVLEDWVPPILFPKNSGVLNSSGCPNRRVDIAREGWLHELLLSAFLCCLLSWLCKSGGMYLSSVKYLTPKAHRSVLEAPIRTQSGGSPHSSTRRVSTFQHQDARRPGQTSNSAPHAATDSRTGFSDTANFCGHD